MRKKIFVVTMLLTMVAGTLAGCSKQECDMCGEKKSCKQYEILGEKINICKDCEKALEELGQLFD